MTFQKGIDDVRGGSRFTFVSRVRYVTNSDAHGKEYEGLAFNVSIEGLCLAVDRPLDVEEEIIITKCILPFCRRRYKVRWIDTTDSITYRVGLTRKDKRRRDNP